ncbi:MAG: hypothetical protein J7K46_03055 [Bacteroidales bacterium]|nr:hypothetical protein [Bacteroidales bacterium]
MRSQVRILHIPQPQKARCEAGFFIPGAVPNGFELYEGNKKTYAAGMAFMGLSGSPDQDHDPP